MNWHLEVDGRPYDVTSETLANGKIAIRVNGRIVAPPQSPDAVDRRIVLGSTPFHVSGSFDALRLEPVIVIQTQPPASPSPGPASSDPVQLRAVVFIVLGALLFVAGTCTFLGTWQSHREEMDRAEALHDPVTQSMFLVGSAIRFSFALVASIGIGAIAGGAMLIGRMPSALFILDVVSWSMAAVPALTLWIVDVLAHRQVAVFADHAAALRFLSVLHTIAIILLIVSGIVAGALSSFLDRRKMMEMIR